MTEVVQLDPHADSDVVAISESCLAAAKSGEITAVAIVLAYTDGNIGTGWVTNNRAMELVGGAALLQKQILEGAIPFTEGPIQ